MGCDIHIHSEIKLAGTWHHYSLPEPARNYELFALMAGVRADDGSPDPICMPRGLPNDITTPTRLAAKWIGPDGHTHSWFGPEEIVALHNGCKEHDIKLRHAWNFGNPLPDYKLSTAFGYLFGNTWVTWAEGEREDYPPGIEDIRWVFWFDN